jgi:hypothetical protein
MEHPIPSAGALPPVAAPAAGAQSGPKPIEMEKLPYSLRGLLSWLPETEWHLINAIVCHGSFIREIAEIARFLDAVWTHSKKAEDRVGDRLTGAERDSFRDRIDHAVKEIVTVTVELARRARLTEILQRNRPLVVRYVPETIVKAAPKPARKTEPPARKEPQGKTVPAGGPPTGSPSGANFLNRWLGGIRRLRESDPSFARAGEVVSMFEKALEVAGPGRAEVEHMLAQYKEAMKHANEGALDAPPAPATQAA